MKKGLVLPYHLITEFIKEKPVGDQVEIYFVDILWEAPSSPTPQEKLVFKVSKTNWEKNKEKYISRILNNRKFFRICGLCGAVTHTGHMYDAYVCQNCAETHYNVIY